MTCRHCGRPVARGKYLPWTHTHGIPRSFRAHYASPDRTALRSAESAGLGAGTDSDSAARSALRSTRRPPMDGSPSPPAGRTSRGTVKPMAGTRAGRRLAAET